MKAKVIDKSYYTPDFEVGEVVEIINGMEADTADIWNAPIGKAWLCKKQDGTFRYNIPQNLQIIEAEEENWQELRNQAAIAAMQGFLSRQTYKANLTTMTDLTTLAKDSVILADCLIGELKKK